MLKKNKNGNCPFGYVEFNGMCVPENQMNRFQFSNEFTSSNGYQPVPPPPPKPPTPPPPPPPPPTPPGPSPAPDDTEAFLRRAAEVTGTIFGLGVGALEADQRYEEYKVLERMRINRAARDAEELDRMFRPPEAGEFEFGVIESGDVLGRELNLYDGEQAPLTDSMGRLLSDERFLINTDTEQNLAEMTDAEIQAEIRRQVEEAETGGTTMRPQDSEETQFRRPSGQEDAEDAVRKEFEESRKRAGEEKDPAEEKDPFDEAVEKYEAKKLERDEAQRRYNERRGIADDGPDGGEDGAVDIDYDNMDLDLDGMGGDELSEPDLDFGEDDYVRGPKQDVSDLADELAEEMGTPLPDDVPSSSNIMTEEEWNSLEPRILGGGEATVGEIGEIGGSEAGMIGEFGGVATEVGETSIIGDIAATTGAADITAAAIIGGEVAAGEAAAFIAGAAGANLLVGAALYGLGVGAEAIYESVTTSDKEYSEQRIDELGSHEMDRREVSYKLQELGAVRDIYEKKVNQGYSVSNKSPKAIAQHEADIAMLNALQTNIDSLNQSFKKDIPVYVVAEDGFDVESLDSDEKATYDRLTKRVSDAQEDVNYGGASAKAENQKRLDNRQRKLDTFINARGGSSVASGFVNKPTDEQMAAIVDDYYENGTDAFGNLSSEQLEVLGVTQAISDRREELEIAGGNFIDDFNNELNNKGINKQQDGIGNLENMNQDAEMQEVYDYLAYMDQRNEEYLASIGQTEALPEAEAEPEAEPEAEAQPKPEIPNIRIGKADITPLPQPQARPRAPMPNDKPDNA